MFKSACHVNGEVEVCYSEQLLEVAHSLASEGLRVLAMAYKEMPSEVQEITHKDVEAEGLIFAGYQAMIDPARPEAVEAIALAKDACNYIYNTYGRLPTIIDPFYCPGVVQVHHIDPDLYDEYMPEGSIWQEQREHLKVWHGLSE